MNVLITGAAKRIGAACARMLHAQGCNIFIHYRSSAEAAVALCDELNGLRQNSARCWQADLLQLDELEAMSEAAVSAWSGLDVLVNNASAFYPTVLPSVTEQQWEELMGSNLKAPFFLTKLLARELAERQGVVINIIDIHAERGLMDYPVYSIAKAGLSAMTRILARELGPEIRVNGISPGAIIWPENEMSDAEKQEILSRIVLGRQGEPDDIAKAVRFLVLDGGYITGQVIHVDGGRTLFS